MKTFKWQVGAAVMATVLALIVSVISWQFALGMVFVAWVTVLDHKWGLDSHASSALQGD